MGSLVGTLALDGCAVNPATGEKQFTALMPPRQESAIGAQQHPQILKTFGGPYSDRELEAYVNTVGQRVAKNTERTDVRYQFFVLDTPMVNAFAVPGGYVYVSRGLLALANSEAELAAVLAHEIGHVTARHSAERYSQSVLTGLGAAVLAAAVDSPDVAQVADIGADLYIKSYSRSQEEQADSLGVRYLHRAGYDPMAMASFLRSLEQYTALEQRLAGAGQEAPFNYFSTHPRTSDRYTAVTQEVRRYPAVQGARVERVSYLARLNGRLSFGESAREGFVRGQTFLHPDAGFTFTVPQGWQIHNQPEQVVALSPGKDAALIFDQDSARADSPLAYLRDVWLRGASLDRPEAMTINGFSAASAALTGQVGGVARKIRVVAIQQASGRFYRFQFAFPFEDTGRIEGMLKDVAYSFRRLEADERDSVRPRRIVTVLARPGDHVADLARRMAVDADAEAWFRALNGLLPGEDVRGGETYKIVAE